MAGRAALQRAGAANAAATASKQDGAPLWKDRCAASAPGALPSPPRLPHASAAARSMAGDAWQRCAYTPLPPPSFHWREKKERSVLRRALSCFLPQ